MPERKDGAKDLRLKGPVLSKCDRIVLYRIYHVEQDTNL